MRRLILFLLGVFITCNALSQEIYVVTAARGLNVRSLPSTDSKIVGSLTNGTLITVYDISSGWAEIEYKGKRAYVYAKYITFKEKVVVESPKEEILEQMPILPMDTDSTSLSTTIKEQSKRKYRTLYEINSTFWNNWGFDLVPSLFVGYSTFISGGSYTPLGICSWGVDANIQFFSKMYKVNYLSEASLGYAMKGTTGRPIHYFIFRVSPLGLFYDFPNDIKLSALMGIYMGSSGTRWQIDLYRNCYALYDAGLQLKVGLEYKNFGCYISYDQGFVDKLMTNLFMSLINTGVNIHFYYRMWDISKNKLYTL